MLVNGDDFYCGNSSGSLCQFALKSMIPSQYIHPSTKQCNYSVDTSQFATISELNSLKTSVSSGKSLVASAVTGKGVNTAADASFQTIANNISSLQVGLSDLQKTFINASKPTYDFDVDSSDTIWELPDTVYISVPSNANRLYARCIVSSNNATSELRFRWYDSKDYYQSSGMTVGITYSVIDGKFIIKSSSTGGSPANCTTTISKIDDYIEIKIRCTPGTCWYTWRDDTYTVNCYWDTACTDQSYKTFTTKLRGYIYCYKSSSNHGGGTIVKIPISDVVI